MIDRRLTAGIILFSSVSFSSLPCHAQEAKQPAWQCVVNEKTITVSETPPTAPIGNSGWIARFEDGLAALKGGKPRYVFLGDSLTHRWPEKEWSLLFPNKDAINLGVDAELTEHLTWRIQHGHVVQEGGVTYVLLIGTNDVENYRKPEVIASSIAKIAYVLQKESPDSRILLLGLLPRSREASNPRRIAVRQVNDLLERCDGRYGIVYLDIGSGLLEKNGDLSPRIAPDGLHLSGEGYARLRAAIAPELLRMAGGL